MVWYGERARGGNVRESIASDTFVSFARSLSQLFPVYPVGTPKTKKKENQKHIS